MKGGEEISEKGPTAAIQTRKFRATVIFEVTFCESDAGKLEREHDDLTDSADFDGTSEELDRKMANVIGEIVKVKSGAWENRLIGTVEAIQPDDEIVIVDMNEGPGPDFF
jgi:hypothetical protein